MALELNSQPCLNICPRYQIVHRLRNPLQSLPSHPLGVIREIDEADDGRSDTGSLIPQDSGVVRVKPNQSPTTKFRSILTELEKLLEASKDLSGIGPGIFRLIITLLRVHWPIDPSGVVPLGRIVHVAVVVELAYFVA